MRPACLVGCTECLETKGVLFSTELGLHSARRMGETQSVERSLHNRVRRPKQTRSTDQLSTLHASAIAADKMSTKQGVVRKACVTRACVRRQTIADTLQNEGVGITQARRVLGLRDAQRH